MFAISEILTASVLYVLHRKQLKYSCCTYNPASNRYEFLFVDKSNIGPSLVEQVKLQHDPLVPARSFRRALTRLHCDFRDEQKRVGNPHSLEVSND